MKPILLGFLFLSIICGVAWSYRTGSIMHVLLDPQIESPTRLALIQSSFHSYGTVAPGVYLLVVIAEVILAPIPGTLLYLPGGLVFGWLVGGSVYLAGNFSVLASHAKSRDSSEDTGLKVILSVPHCKGIW